MKTLLLRDITENYLVKLKSKTIAECKEKKFKMISFTFKSYLTKNDDLIIEVLRQAQNGKPDIQAVKLLKKDVITLQEKFYSVNNDIKTINEKQNTLKKVCNVIADLLYLKNYHCKANSDYTKHSRTDNVYKFVSKIIADDKLDLDYYREINQAEKSRINKIKKTKTN